MRYSNHRASQRWSETVREIRGFILCPGITSRFVPKSIIPASKQALVCSSTTSTKRMAKLLQSYPYTTIERPLRSSITLIGPAPQPEWMSTLKEGIFLFKSNPGFLFSSSVGHNLPQPCSCIGRMRRSTVQI